MIQADKQSDNVSDVKRRTDVRKRGQRSHRPSDLTKQPVTDLNEEDEPQQEVTEAIQMSQCL